MSIIIDTETTGLDTFACRLLGIAISTEDGVTSYGEIDINQYLPDTVVAHNGKYDKKVIANQLGINVNIDYDTMIAYALLHIDRPKKLETIIKDVFGEHKADLVELYNEATGKNRKSIPNDWYKDIPEEKIAEYSQEDVAWTRKIKEYCDKQFKEFPKLKDWFEKIEMPMVNILGNSELKGVRVDVSRLKELENKIIKKRNYLSVVLKEIAENDELNLNSSKQLQEVLYKKLRLPKLKKTKTGTSTDTKTLSKLADKDGFCKLLLEYRELTKVLTSFVIPLQERADINDRIHATFNQCGTKTRRMSCQEPNLQQIPVRTNLGSEIRKAFIPSDGHKFLIADYSQVELRLLAHFSQEPKLLKAFKNNEDIHTETSEYISGKLGREFDRRQGKILNFSIIYGKTSYGFAQDWDCSREDAQKILDAYFELYPRVKEWIKEQQIECQANGGWLETVGGLPLYVKNINSNDRYEFEEAKRQAVNYKIQGSSQDIIKTAIVNIHKELNLLPVLMVHDELVYELENTLNDRVVKRIMEEAWKLDVPLVVDYKISDHWEK